ncbi:thioesterase family protein [Caulobacter sp. KR2-114]|uniref:thioesterase family protein n=1 Tax=Caulobacter sp. KR2-114 TaxID=3400912 RepID=UPI003BFC8E44
MSGPAGENAPQDGAIEVWRGGVNTWELDDMGHMNVRFYVARAAEGLVGLAAALGLPDAFRPSAGSTLLIREQHIRFIREARSRAPLHMTAGVLEIGESEARVLQLLVHSDSGEIAAAIQSVVAHVTAGDGRAFPWSPRTLERAAALRTTVPAHAAPRSLTLEPRESIASLAAAEHMGLVRLAAGAFLQDDCDVFGRMRVEQFIGRVSDGVPRLASAFRAEVTAASAAPPARVGGAVLEYRILHLAWPRIGDRFEVRSGVAGVDHRAQRMVHWMLDPESGRAWGTSEAVAISLDLDARKIIPITEDAQAAIRRRITPGLAL